MNVYIRSVFNSGVMVFQVTTDVYSRFMDLGQVELVNEHVRTRSFYYKYAGIPTPIWLLGPLSSDFLRYSNVPS